MKTLELFSGLKSFSKIAKERGHETFTIDIEKEFKPDLIADILYLDEKKIPFNRKSCSCSARLISWSPEPKMMSVPSRMDCRSA